MDLKNLSIEENLRFSGFKKSHTKTLKKAFAEHQKSRLLTLNDCYNTYSIAKEDAFAYCKGMERLLKGFDGRIIAYNTMQFSYGFSFTDDYGEVHFAYITKDYNRFVEESFCNNL